MARLREKIERHQGFECITLLEKLKVSRLSCWITAHVNHPLRPKLNQLGDELGRATRPRRIYYDCGGFSRKTVDEGALVKDFLRLVRNETAIGNFPAQAVSTMSKTILSTEKYKKEHIEDFKNSILSNKDPVKSVLLSVKDIAYNPDVKAIIVFSNSGKSAKLVSSIRPAAKILTISPNINISRQVSLLWGVQSINSRDANGWKDMMSISKEIIKKLRFIKKDDFVIITAGLPFGRAGMTNMIRLYKVGK